MRRLLLALALLWPSVGWAQNVMCPTRNFADATNACASTAFVTTGIAANFASPPPIGNVTPNTGAFTSLTSTLASSIAGVPFNPSITPPGSFSPAAFPGILMPSGHPFYIVGAPTSAAQDLPSGTLYVTSFPNYTGTGIGTPPAIYGLMDISPHVQGPHTGILGVAVNDNTEGSQPGGPSGAVGTYGLGICDAPGCTATWGGLIAAYDTTGVTPTNAQIGLEIDNYANGPDTNGIRVVLQLVCGKNNPAGATNVCANQILAGGTVGNAYNFNGTAVNGINLGGATFTGSPFLSPGFHVDSAGNEFPNSINLASSRAIAWGLNTGSNGGQVVIDNTSTNMFFDLLAGGSWTFRTTGLVVEAAISNTGVYSSAGTAGVTCAPGAPTASFSTKGGIVTHC